MRPREDPTGLDFLLCFKPWEIVGIRSWILDGRGGVFDLGCTTVSGYPRESSPFFNFTVPACNLAHVSTVFGADTIRQAYRDSTTPTCRWDIEHGMQMSGPPSHCDP